jgi:polyisoprenoid-binding protein YceI
MRLIKALITISILTSVSLFASDSYKVSNTDTKLKWTGEKVSGEHFGHVTVKSGEVIFNDGKLIGGNFVMDMTTITVEDIEGEWQQKLLGHLQSDDFFSVNQHKEAKFVVTNIKDYENGKAKVTGNLTIKGITKQVRFDVNHSVKGGVYTATGQIKIDRTKFDIKYNSGNFFENLGDKLIYDDFTIDLNLIAKK